MWTSQRFFISLKPVWFKKKLQIFLNLKFMTPNLGVIVRWCLFFFVIIWCEMQLSQRSNHWWQTQAAATTRSDEAPLRSYEDEGLGKIPRASWLIQRRTRRCCQSRGPVKKSSNLIGRRGDQMLLTRTESKAEAGTSSTDASCSPSSSPSAWALDTSMVTPDFIRQHVQTCSYRPLLWCENDPFYQSLLQARSRFRKGKKLWRKPEGLNTRMWGVYLSNVSEMSI